jgi:uncharacterized protein (DUF488 family)
MSKNGSRSIDLEKTMKLFTIGYEGHSLDSFAALLSKFEVRRIIDVREIPLSHKPGFSKTRLKEFLQSMGINYVHLPALGCPKEIRREYRADQDYERYKVRYLAHMEIRQDELASLLKMALETQSCLLCFEADSSHCHRTFIAERLADMSEGKLVGEPIIPDTTAS